MNKRKTFTSEFKREAVRLMGSSQKPASDVARQLGVRRNQLYKWKEQLEQPGPTLGLGEVGASYMAVVLRHNNLINLGF